ncbi:MAG: hypothetical protein M1829_003977 [Trizodia sp. TS-e1964]|nr:MAG: hypothetical protein M1829_003977 [Trizodia sp. TS-e1964]
MDTANFSLPFRTLSETLIKVNSLEETVEAHRRVNKASLIRKIWNKPDTGETTIWPGNNASKETDTEKAHSPPPITPPQKPSPKKSPVELKRKYWLEYIAKLKALKLQSSDKGRVGEVKTPPRDYDGVYFPLRKRYRTQNTNLHSPWLKYLKWESGDGFSRLHAEILAFEEYMKLSPTEKSGKDRIQQDFLSKCNEIVPGTFLQASGSSQNGLATALSELDFSLKVSNQKEFDERGPSPTRPAARKLARNVLETICQNLKNDATYEDIALSSSNATRLTCIHAQTGIPITVSAIRSLDPSDVLVQAYLAEFPSIRPLYMLAYNILHIRGFTDHHFGGMSPYTLAMLLTTYFKMNPEPNTGISHIYGQSLGRELLAFLKFISSFNTSINAISVEPAQIFVKEAAVKRLESEDPLVALGRRKIGAHRPTAPYLLCLQDPANPLNDAGMHVWGIKHIQAIFARAFAELSKAVEQYPDAKNRITDDPLGESILVHVISGHYTADENRRLALAAFQVQESAQQWTSEEAKDLPSYLSFG